MAKSDHAQLSPLERKIMNVLYRLGEASAAEVARRVNEKGGHDSVRVTLRILEKKGHVSHRQDGRRYLYAPTVPHDSASRSAMRSTIRTFFRGSPKRAVLALLGMSRLSKDELDEIAQRVEQARRSHESDGR